MAQLTQEEQDFLEANIEGVVNCLLSDADRARYKGLRAKERCEQGVYSRLVNAKNRGEPADPADVALVKATPFVPECSATWLLDAVAGGITTAVTRGKA